LDCRGEFRVVDFHARGALQGAQERGGAFKLAEFHGVEFLQVLQRGGDAHVVYHVEARADKIVRGRGGGGRDGRERVEVGDGDCGELRERGERRDEFFQLVKHPHGAHARDVRGGSEKVAGE